MSENSFQSTLMSCQLTRLEYSKLSQGLPNSFKFSRDGKQVLFLSSGSLYSQQLEPSRSSVTVGNWQKLCEFGNDREPSRSEELLFERMRATRNGITSYDYIYESDSIVVHGSKCVVVDKLNGLVRVMGEINTRQAADVKHAVTEPIGTAHVQESFIMEFPELVGAINHQVCPSCPTLLGCVFEGDVWLLDANNIKKHQLTFTAGDRINTRLTAGQPSFIVQEEFDRYSGYWWQPQMKDGKLFRILYEEVDERNVETVNTFNPSTQEIESYFYPRAGGGNAQSCLKLLEFSFSEGGEISITTMTLPWTVSELYPECSEYIARVGWMEDSKHIWVQLLDRTQKRLKVVIIALESFVSEGSNTHPPLPYVLWEESTEVWITITNILKFLPSSASGESLEFLWCSDCSGYMHLYLITARVPKESYNQSLKAECSVQQLTSGNWVVFGSEIWVDTRHRVVFFEANVTSPLDRQFKANARIWHVKQCELGQGKRYALALDSTSLPCVNPVQLTIPGYYHSVKVDAENHTFVTVFSNECSSPSVAAYSITIKPLSCAFMCSIWTGPALPVDYVPPSRFQVRTETGDELHGEVYTPAMESPGKKYPTILYVYGGPHVQLVTKAFSKQFPRIAQWIRCGFVVVMLDNRGSANRGVKFESVIKDHLGNKELKDQVAGLHKAVTMFDFIDDSRVAITGWSYGGYLSLLGIATYSHIFKIAVSGAPVTDWLWYDTGYTERYLGVTPNSESYQQSSVLNVCDKFPNEPNRLLIIHGLNDENVFFTHTSLLCDKLVQLAKPYQLQLYTGERHGLRKPTSAAHCDATVLTFLLKNL